MPFCGLTFLQWFWWRGFRDGVAEGAVGRAVAAILGLLLGHVDALLRFAVELRGGTVVETK